MKLAFWDGDSLRVVSVPVVDGIEESVLLERAALPYLRFSPVVVKSVPSSRRFRDSWRLNGSIIEEDMKEAKAEIMKECREWRDAQLRKTDAELLRVQEVDEGMVQAVKDYRRSLRELPGIIQKKVDRAQTIDDLYEIDITGGL